MNVGRGEREEGDGRREKEAGEQALGGGRLENKRRQ